MLSIKNSRETAVYGVSIQKKKGDFSIFIYGFNGLSSEICKNLILSGVKSVDIFEEPHQILKLEDLQNNCFAKIQDVGEKTRAYSSLPNLQILNHESKVRIITEISKENLEKYDMIIICDEFDKKKIIELIFFLFFF